MYSLTDIKTLHLEITNKCQASCPMCARNIQGGIDNPFMTLGEISFETFKEWFTVDFIKQLDRLYMCGNLGDPIVAKDTVEVFAYCRDINPSIHLSMNTNGSARTRRFWEQLAELKVSIRFGIDGLVDTHSIYRRGTDFNTIIKNATTFINHGGYAVWDMLVFDHNKHQVDECRQLSNELGFKEFNSKNTSRFKEESLVVLDTTGRPEYRIYGTERSIQLKDKMSSIDLTEPKVTINCKAKAENSLYVSAIGIVSPCCWLDVEWMPHVSHTRIDYLEKIKVYKNLNENTMAEIFESGFFKKIEDTWACDSVRECSKQCGKIDKLNEQFK